MHKIVSKSNFVCPAPTPLDKVSVVDKLLYEPLANTIARMEQSGYVAAEFRRKQNMAMYDSRIAKSESELDAFEPMPMYPGDFTDVTSARDYANSAIMDRVNNSALATSETPATSEISSSEVANG